MATREYYKGDTVNNAVKVTFDNFELLDTLNISYAIFQVGLVQKRVEREDITNPMYLSFTREQTKKFASETKGYVAFYNSVNEKFTAKGSFTLNFKQEVVKDE